MGRIGGCWSTSAYRDQEMARLFNESGWTQERIAEKVGKSRSWVTLRLTLGRFLSLVTTGHQNQKPPGNLTERRFRSLYRQTKGSESARFQAVADMLAAGKGVNKPQDKQRIIGARAVLIEVPRAIPPGVAAREGEHPAGNSLAQPDA